MEDLQQLLIDHLLKKKQEAAVQRPFILGVYGPQGSGKTTLSNQLCERLGEQGLKARTVSLDDYYLTRAARQKLAREVHPLLATRGVPGTHDLDSGLTTFRDVLAQRPTKLPVFNKAIDDVEPESKWHTLDEPLDFLIFEGWCVGLPELLIDDLAQNPTPLNALESEQDSDAVWRRYVAHHNKAYQQWYKMIDYMIGFSIPAFECIERWRWQQECDLYTQTGQRYFQSLEEIRHFIEYYERITRVAQQQLHGFVQCVISIHEDHTFKDVQFLD